MNSVTPHNNPQVDNLQIDDAAEPRKQPKLNRAIAAFFLFTALIIFTPLSRGAIVIYPAFAFLFALFLIQRSKPAYVTFICWLWFLTPFVRRVVDWRGGGSTSIILVTPFLAIGVAALSLVPNLSGIFTRRTAPMLYAFSAIVYGIVIGILHFAFSGMPQAVISWIMPLIFGLFLYQERAHSEEIHRSFEKSMVGFLLVSGLYGIYQFFAIPVWDAQWMLNSNLNSIGLPEPMQVRVFSTMNSPQVFAAFCACGLLVALRAHGKLRFLAIPAGFIAFLLTISRTAWIGFAAGIVYLFFLIGSKQRVRIITAAGACVIFSLAILQIPEINSIASARLSTFTDPQHDSSVNARMTDYNTLIQTVIEEPFGHGLSSDATSDEPTKAGVAMQDSSISTALISLGILGTLLFFGSLTLLGFSILTSGDAENAPLIAVKATLLAIAVESPFNGVIAGPVAFLLWCCVGLCVAEIQWLSEHPTPQSDPQPEQDASSFPASAALAN